jgi:predicted MFS family arabinose efflux permease
MHTANISSSTNMTRGSSGMAAVLSMALCVMVLIASEFLPVSLLTPIAADLQVTEGHAGQAISISGVFAVLTSLLVSAMTRRLDRRPVLLSLTALMFVSGIVVAAAPNFFVLMIGRALLGISIGGFWSMSTATVMRLVPADRVPRALALLNGGNALAATVAAPLGSFAGGLIGWRGAFFCVVPLAAVALAWQFMTLPTMRSSAPSSGNVFTLLRRSHVAYGMAAILLLFMGQFALFTYLRPFLESATHVDVSTLSLLLLAIGVAGLLGTSLIERLLHTQLSRIVVITPLAMAAIALALVAFGSNVWATAGLLTLWGLIATPAPVAWGTWLTRSLPQDAEAGGGLMVATIQFAITLGASLGGLLFDARGYEATFGVSAAVLFAAAFVAFKAGHASVSAATMVADVPPETLWRRHHGAITDSAGTRRHVSTHTPLHAARSDCRDGAAGHEGVECHERSRWTLNEAVHGPRRKGLQSGLPERFESTRCSMLRPQHAAAGRP